MFENFFRAVFGSRGAVVLHTPSLVVQPGATIPVQIRFEALEQAREVAFLRLHLHMTVHQWGQGPAGPTIQPQTRDVLPPVMVSEKFVVAAGGVQDFSLQVTIPQGVYPTVPGQIDYALWAVAPVAGQTIDSAQHLPLTIVSQNGAIPFAPMGAAPMGPAPIGAPFPSVAGPMYGPVPANSPVPATPIAAPVAAPVTAPVTAPVAVAVTPASAPAFAPGQDVEALAPDQRWLPAMVVEVRGPVLFVQWQDGRAATWVRAEQVRAPAPPAPPAPPAAPAAPDTPPSQP
jgi:hypothetical protein